MGNISSVNANSPETSRLLILLLVLHRYWQLVLANSARRAKAQNEKREDSPEPARVLHCEEEFSYVESPSSICGCSWCEFPETRCSFSESKGQTKMAPNSEEDRSRIKRLEDIWSTEDSSKELQRPPVYNPEDYALSLRKWGRRPSVASTSAQPLYGSLPPDQEANKSKTLPATVPSSKKETRDFRNPILSPTPPCGEMSLRQFSSVSELLLKLKSDLKLAFPSFVQEFVGDPLDGVTLLLELLRSVQLSQAANQGKYPAPVLRRALLDEHACLQCLKSCLRCQDAARRLAASPAGLFTLAVCIMSNVSKSRVIALELLTKACEPPGCGHVAVSEALSTLRLRFGEPVRFRFLIGMLSSAGGCPELQAAGLRFLNTFVETAPTQQQRLYLQAELDQAGFSATSIKKILPSNPTAAQQVKAELARWERNYIDVELLKGRIVEAEREAAAAKDKVQLLERRIQILQEEKEILLSLEGCLKERCCELEKEVSSLKSSGLRRSIFQRQTSSNTGKSSSCKKEGGGSTPAEDEGISSSDQDQSLSLDEEEIGDIEREPMVYELFDVQNDTILVDRHSRSRNEIIMKETSVDQIDDDDVKPPLDSKSEDDEEETTIDEVIEELRNIINDAETEAYAAEAADARKKQKEAEEKMNEEKRKLRLEEERVKRQQKRCHSTESTYLKNSTEKSGAIEDDIVPSRILPQPPRRTRSLIHLMYQGREYVDSSTIRGDGSQFFDEDTPSHTTDEEEEDSDSLLSASKERDKKNTRHNRSLPETYVPEENEHYGKIFRYSITNGNVGTSYVDSKYNHYVNVTVTTNPPQEVDVRRSESFHHIIHQSAEDLNQKEEKQGGPYKNKVMLSGKRCGSFDGLFFVTDQENVSPQESLRVKTSSVATENTLLKKIEEEYRTNLDLASKKLRSKSLERIDNSGLDSMVDIILTTDHDKSHVSSGRGSVTEEYSLEWDKSYMESRSKKSLVEAAQAYNTPPPIVIVSRSSNVIQPTLPVHQDSQSTYFPRHPINDQNTLGNNSRHPSEGSNHSLFLPNLSNRGNTSPNLQPVSISNSQSGKTFVIKRGPVNAGMYSGQNIRDKRGDVQQVYIKPPNEKKRAPTPSPSNSKRRSLVDVTAKLADVPSGLY